MATSAPEGSGAPEALTCKEFVEVVTDYLEDALPPAARAQVEAHLAGCAGCRAYLGQLQRTIRVLGVLDEAPATPLQPTSKRRLLEMFRAWKGG